MFRELFMHLVALGLIILDLTHYSVNTLDYDILVFRYCILKYRRSADKTLLILTS